MEGFYTNSEESFNNVDYGKTNVESMKKILIELIDSGDYIEVRKIIRRNKECNTLNTRELNEDIPADKHKFVKRDGKMLFITCKYSQQRKDCTITTNTMQNEPCKEDKIIDAVDLYSYLLNQLIDYLLSKCCDFDIDFKMNNFLNEK